MLSITEVEEFPVTPKLSFILFNHCFECLKKSKVIQKNKGSNTTLTILVRIFKLNVRSCSC